MPAHVQAAAAAAVRPPRPRRVGLGAARHGLAQVGSIFGNIFFIPNPWIGLILALALLPQPAYIPLALEGLAIGALVNLWLGLVDEPASGGGVRTNAMLAAIVTGWVTSASGIGWPLQMAFAAAAAVPAAVLAAALSRFLSRNNLPAVLLAYCIAASMIFAICPRCTVAASAAMPPWPGLSDPSGWGAAFLRSLAAFMYGQDWTSGALIGLAVLAWSRAMFLCGAAGWAAGAAAALGFEGLHLDYFWLPLSYNFFMAGAALGAGVFLPGNGSLLLAMGAGAATSFFALAIQSALAASSASYLPLSSALAIWAGIGALSRVRVRASAAGGGEDMKPEQQWWWWAYWRTRFGVEVPLLAVPVVGELEVSQGFDGEVSHRGEWKHALDFRRPGAGAAIGAISGTEVRSPVPGIVERIRNDVADNAPGTCNYAAPYGNCVTIRMDGSDDRVVLAHLAQGSVAVWPGMRVEVGSFIGRVGNSGRSGFAHLHMQVQPTPQPGGPTRPFRLANYVVACASEPDRQPWVASGVPSKGDVVAAAPVNAAVYRMLSGIGPGCGVWTVRVAGRVPRRFRPPKRNTEALRVQVGIDSFGRHVFADAHGGRLVARLDPDAWRIVEIGPGCSPLLLLLGWAASTIPYGARSGLSWTDHPPLPPGRLMLELGAYARKPFVRVASRCVVQGEPEASLLETAGLPDHRRRGWPVEVGCAFAALKGPVRIRARFPRGSLEFSLLSYDTRSAS